jgi:hypothetical protein
VSVNAEGVSAAEKEIGRYLYLVKWQIVNTSRGRLL